MSADWFIRWALIAAISVIDAIWMWAKGIGFVTAPAVGLLAPAGMIGAWCLLSPLLVARRRRLAPVFFATSDFLYSFMQALLMVPPITALTYLAASVNLPLADGILQRADALLGFDWPAFDAWMSTRPMMVRALTLAYTTIAWQPIVVMFLVSVGQPGATNGEFLWNLMISAIIATAVSALVPALGYEGVIGSPHIDALQQIRAGAWQTLNFEKVDGIITFPSFHAALGVLFPYSVRRIRWAFWILVPLNLLLILSTPTVGGHYLADVVVGCGLGVVSIVLVRRIQSWTAPLSFSGMGWPLGLLNRAAAQAQ